MEKTMKDGRIRREAEKWLQDLRAALMFLTILPVGGEDGTGAPPVRPRFLRALPLAGAVVGGLSGMVLILSGWAGAPAMIGAALAVAAGIVLTGAMHEDGLSDMADGLGGRTRERRLEIMRDPAVGAFGVLALVLAVLLNVLAVAHVAEVAGFLRAAAVLTAAHAVSRLASVRMLHALPPARPDGRGREAGRPGDGILFRALMAALVVVAAAGAPAAGTVATAGALAVAALAGEFAIRRTESLLGGQTGDAAGAVEVVVRTVFLVTLAIFVTGRA